MSNIVEFLTSIRPGTVIDSEATITIEHSNGDTSTFWKAHGKEVPKGLSSLGELYSVYDGADILSSTFKVASRLTNQVLGEVEITPTLAELRNWASEAHAEFPVDAVPFMSESGVWIYAFHPLERRILKWDLENNAMAEAYEDVNEILRDWARAMSES